MYPHDYDDDDKCSTFEGIKWTALPHHKPQLFILEMRNAWNELIILFSEKNGSAFVCSRDVSLNPTYGAEVSYSSKGVSTSNQSHPVGQIYV